MLATRAPDPIKIYEPLYPVTRILAEETCSAEAEVSVRQEREHLRGNRHVGIVAGATKASASKIAANLFPFGRDEHEGPEEHIEMKIKTPSVRFTTRPKGMAHSRGHTRP